MKLRGRRGTDPTERARRAPELARAHDRYSSPLCERTLHKPASAIQVRPRHARHFRSGATLSEQSSRSLKNARGGSTAKPSSDLLRARGEDARNGEEAGDDADAAVP